MATSRGPNTYKSTPSSFNALSNLTSFIDIPIFRIRQSIMRKKNIILKAWERCRSLGAGTGNIINRSYLKFKGRSKSLSEKSQIAPRGCFSVHVGPDRERFVVKTECVNHPLFQILLEQAEQEFGLKTNGPIRLPCNVDFFCQVLAQMDHQQHSIKAKGFSFLVLRSPSHLFCSISKAHTAYSVMDSEFLRLNQFQ